MSILNSFGDKVDKASDLFGIHTVNKSTAESILETIKENPNLSFPELSSNTKNVANENLWNYIVDLYHKGVVRLFHDNKLIPITNLETVGLHTVATIKLS